MRLIRLAALVAAALPLVLQAQPSAHYVPGAEGIKGASLPPPGLYLRDYTIAYTADRLNDAAGHEINGIGADAFIFANVPRLLWITDTKVLEGNLGFDALLPVKNTDLRVKAAGFDHSTLGIGDLFTEATLSWHIPQCDTAIGYGLWIPTGTSAGGLNTKAGSGFWTHMFTAGVTWYFDSDKAWAISLLNRYEISSKQRHVDFTPGDTDTLEWGLSYAATKTLDVGLAGYFQRQVGRASGTAASPGRSRVSGVGPEVSGFIPGATLGWSLRWVHEFNAKNRFQGDTIALTLTKVL